MKKSICLCLVAVMFVAIVASCDAIDVEGRIKVASDQLSMVDQRLVKLNQDINQLTQARIEIIGRLKELQSIYNEQQQALEAPIVPVAEAKTE